MDNKNLHPKDYPVVELMLLLTNEYNIPPDYVSEMSHLEMVNLALKLEIDKE